MIFPLPFVTQGLFLRFPDQHYPMLFVKLGQAGPSQIIFVFIFGFSKIHDIQSLFLGVLLDLPCGKPG
jgi:hypothetical protein